MVFVALAACSYDASFRDCAVRCAPDGSCPADLTCGNEGLCRDPSAATAACAPSCTGLAATCGPDGSDDCCSIATPIPGGTFYRSYDVGSDGMYPDMSYPATVSPFRLDKYEVTVGRFRQFVAAGLGTQASPPAAGAGARHLNGSDDQGGWDPSWDADLATDTAALGSALQCDPTYQTWTTTPGANEDLPIVCVSWYDAFAFCAWDAGFLPTAAEWNFAAAAGTAQRAYPWSDPPNNLTIDCTRANYDPDASYDPDYTPGDPCVKPPNGALSHVGAESPQGDGEWGQSDLAGNAWQWVLDEATPYTEHCEDCASLGTTASRLMRGGAFDVAAPALRAANLNNGPASYRYNAVGMRCARKIN